MAAESSKRHREEHGASLWLLAGHDFRQPPQSLRLLAHGLVRASTEEERRQYASSIARVAAALGDMVEGLSLVARLEAGEIVPAPASLSIAEAVATAEAHLGVPPEQSRGCIVMHGLSGAALADAALAGAALRGVLLYAIKYNEAGDIMVEAEQRDGRIVLRFTFWGRHPEAARAEMAFVELPPPGPDSDRPLVALGPALVGRVVRLMGGTLAMSVESPGRASISLSLPAAKTA